MACAAGFHHVAVPSVATATKAPPMPIARSPTDSKTCAEAGPAVSIRQTNAKTQSRRDDVDMLSGIRLVRKAIITLHRFLGNETKAEPYEEFV